MCAKKMIHSCEELFRGRGGQNFVFEIAVFGRCDESGNSHFFIVEDLFVNSEFRFAPSALSSATGTLGLGNLWSKPRGRGAIRQKTSCGWGVGVK